VELQELRPVAAEDGGGGDHFGVQERVGGEAAEEVAAVAVGPVHHGRHGKPSVQATDFLKQNTKMADQSKKNYSDTLSQRCCESVNRCFYKIFRFSLHIRHPAGANWSKALTLQQLGTLLLSLKPLASGVIAPPSPKHSRVIFCVDMRT